MGLTVTSIVAAILLVAGFISSKSWSTDDIDRNDEPPEPSASTDYMPVPPSYMYNHAPVRYIYRPKSMESRRHHLLAESRGYESMFDSHLGLGAGHERNDFYYILPILLVIGLGSFLIPIISTFFTAMITSNQGLGGCCGRRRRNGSELKVKPPLVERVYETWESVEKAIEKFTRNFSDGSTADFANITENDLPESRDL